MALRKPTAKKPTAEKCRRSNKQIRRRIAGANVPSVQIASRIARNPLTGWHENPRRLKRALQLRHGPVELLAATPGIFHRYFTPQWLQDLPDCV
jgi:hypothetical protein